MPRNRGGGGNRTDLLTKAQPVRTATGGPYGEAKQLAQAQQAAPLPQPQAPPPGLQAQAHQAAQATPPPSRMIHAPSERPEEPLTTGLATGPGAGPEVLAGGGALGNQTLSVLQGIYSKFPSDEMRALVKEAQRRAGITGAGV